MVSNYNYFHKRVICVLILISVLFSNTYFLSAQNFGLKKLTNLNKIVGETSGLLWLNDTLFTHNDSDGDPCLYAINISNGDVVFTQCYDQIKNYDWEDITYDENFVYIGDIGNNAGARNTLMIFKIKRDSFYDNKASIDTISFVFADQKDFSKNYRRTNFDCESLFDAGNKLIVFSKNWQNLNSRMYFVPKEPGAYKIDPILEFEAKGLITGADFNEELGILALIGYEKNIPFNSLFYILKFNEDFTKIKNFIRITLPFKNKQTEGIIWENCKSLIISNEDLLNVKAQLYRINLENFNLLNFMCQNMPTPDYLIKEKSNMQVKLINNNGEEIYSGKLKHLFKNKTTILNTQKPVLFKWKSKNIEGWFIWE